MSEALWSRPKVVSDSSCMCHIEFPPFKFSCLLQVCFLLRRFAKLAIVCSSFRSHVHPIAIASANQSTVAVEPHLNLASRGSSPSGGNKIEKSMSIIGVVKVWYLPTPSRSPPLHAACLEYW